MLIIFIHMALTAAVLGTDFWCRRKSTANRRATAASSLPHSDFKSPAELRNPALGALLVTIAVMAGGALSLWPMAVSALCFVGFTALRLGLLRMTTTAARRSYVMRYASALDVPKIKSARIALYFTEPRLATPYQATMWLEPLIALNEPFVILLKERKHLKHFPKSDLYEVLLVSDMPANTPFLPDSTEVVFYVNNCMANLNVIKANPNVTHVQLLHGDSDKPPSYNPMSAVYDHLFVAGEMAIDRYARNGVAISPDKFRIVGRPQLAAPQNSKASQPPSTGARKTVVYMTTWAGMFEDSNFCSLPQAHDILHHTVQSGQPIDVIFKPHPVSFRDPSWSDVQAKVGAATAALPAGVTFRMADPSEDPFALYEAADVLITDISSTVIDYLYTGKPYIVTNPHDYTDAFLEAYPSVEGGHLAAPDAANLPELLADCLGADQLAAKRIKLRLYAFGDFGRPQQEAFQEACHALLKSQDLPQKKPLAEQQAA
ncbi:hypothetical protein NBRC116594_38380 [Shimia sp. NS0008-38b]|uniref:CDP-glycerol glycerophosphotransferase family protein n=1 Tax=Shimia sp. NS0008-38b TaxID=3127653 RepID=UPI003101F6AD